MTKPKEGARAFSVIVQEIDDGQLHTELSETLQELVGKLVQHAENTGRKSKGGITLSIGLEASKNGTVSVQADVRSKTPKESRPGTTFFATKGDNLSTVNQRQAELPGIREVPKPAAAEPDAAPRPSINL